MQVFLAQDEIGAVHIEGPTTFASTWKMKAQTHPGLPILPGRQWVLLGSKFQAYLDGHSKQTLDQA